MVVKSRLRTLLGRRRFDNILQYLDGHPRSTPAVGLKNPTEEEMNFIKFHIVLILSGFPAVVLFSIGVVICATPLALLSRIQKPRAILLHAAMVPSVVFQVWFWGLWAAYCVAVTYSFTARPTVTWVWIYFVSGFFEAASLIAWLSSKERQGAESAEEDRSIVHGTLYYAIVAWIAYVVFALSPATMWWLYKWPLGLIPWCR